MVGNCKPRKVSGQDQLAARLPRRYLLQARRRVGVRLTRPSEQKAAAVPFVQEPFSDTLGPKRFLVLMPVHRSFANCGTAVSQPRRAAGFIPAERGDALARWGQAPPLVGV